MPLPLFFWLAQIVAIFINIYFVWELTNRRHSQENRCFFLYHCMTLAFTNILVVLYNFALLNNPLEGEGVTISREDALPSRLVWAIGVYLHLTQQMTALVLSLSRMVAMTFKWHMQTYVWESRVSNFAIAVQFLFPLMFVVCYLLDSPLTNTRNRLSLETGDVLFDYLSSRRFIYSVTFVFAFGAHIVIVARRLYVNCERVRLREERARARLRGEGSDDSNTTESGSDLPRVSVFTIPHTPTVQPTFAAREFHFSLLVLLQVLAQLYHWFVRDNEALPSGHPDSLLASMLVSVCLPLLLSIYWTLPHLVFYYKYNKCCCNRAVVDDAVRTIHFPNPSAIRPVSTSDVLTEEAQRSPMAVMTSSSNPTGGSFFLPSASPIGS